MRKIGYGLVGILLGIIVYLLMLTNIPVSADVKSTLAEFDKPKQEEHAYNDNYGGDIIPFNEDGTYHVSVVDFKNYEENGVVKYGKVNPMFYFTKTPVVQQPEPGEPGGPNEGTPDKPITPKPPTDNEVPGLGSNGDNLAMIYKGFNIKTGFEEDKDVAIILDSFEKYGKLPVEPEYYNITSDFGKREDPFLTGVIAYHVGLDIGKAGIDQSNIYSAIQGEVIYVGYDKEGYGNYVILRHDGFDTLYGHMTALSSLVAGDYVEAGSIIGQVGSTGRSTGPHLHFEVIMDDVRFNPITFINKFRKGK